jgi:hypothetical protein
MDVNFAHSLVMRRRMTVCEIICQILIAWAPVHIKLALFHSVFNPIKRISIAFVRFCFIVPLLYPVEVVLYVSIGVGGCGCPSSSNVVQRTAPSLAFIKKLLQFLPPQPKTVRV